MEKLLLQISLTSFGIYLYHNSFIGVIVAPIFRRYVTVLPELGILVVLLVAAVATILLVTGGVMAAQFVLIKLGVKNTRWIIA
jgi:surface polysaccharide O-acyltransferase-like enzyme